MLAEQLDRLQPPLLLDVTTEQEWREKRIGESANIPLTRLGRQIEELPRDRPIGVHCSSGYRAAIAASLLLAAGFRQISDLVGGVSAWASSRLETVVSEPV